MDKNRLMQESAEFQRPRCAYIHTEVNDGKPQTVICGDMQAMLWGIVAEIDRISHKARMDFDDSLVAIKILRELGYDEATKGTDYSKFSTIEGEDWQTKWQEKIKTQLQREADVENANLRVDLKKATEDKKVLEKKVAYINSLLNAEKSKVADCEKEIRKLNADLRRMEKAINGKHNSNQ